MAVLVVLMVKGHRGFQDLVEGLLCEGRLARPQGADQVSHEDVVKAILEEGPHLLPEGELHALVGNAKRHECRTSPHCLGEIARLQEGAPQVLPALPYRVIGQVVRDNSLWSHLP